MAGYLGFKLYTDANQTLANHGWMRVIFNDNITGTLIKEWAYDNSCAVIATGNSWYQSAQNNILPFLFGDLLTCGAPSNPTVGTKFMKFRHKIQNYPCKAGSEFRN